MSIANLPSPENRADSLLARTGQEEPPLSFERLLSLWSDLKISLEDIEGPGYLLDLGAQGAEILLKSTDPLPRRRFTVAHELGHWVLKAEGYPLNCESDETTRVRIEKWCDTFAAALLMPRRWILTDLKTYGLTEILAYVVGAPDDYGVSHQAFRLRLVEVVPVSLWELQNLRGNFVPECAYPSRFLEPTVADEALRRAAALVHKNVNSSHYVDHQTHLDVYFGVVSQIALLCVLDQRKTIALVNHLRSEDRVAV